MLDELLELLAMFLMWLVTGLMKTTHQDGTCVSRSFGRTYPPEHRAPSLGVANHHDYSGVNNSQSPRETIKYNDGTTEKVECLKVVLQ